MLIGVLAGITDCAQEEIHTCAGLVAHIKLTSIT